MLTEYIKRIEVKSSNLMLDFLKDSDANLFNGDPEDMAKAAKYICCISDIMKDVHEMASELDRVNAEYAAELKAITEMNSSILDAVTEIKKNQESEKEKKEKTKEKAKEN